MSAGETVPRARQAATVETVCETDRQTVTRVRANDPADDGAPLELSARYEDAGRIGRGGMGEVRALRDAELGREVAAKTLEPGLASRPAFVRGFVDEARITAQLEHPNIVPVHDLGVDREGTRYFTMKRVQGQTLHALLAEPALEVGSSARLGVALEVFLKTCDAIGFAHSRGVIHRDIKPGNIMVGTFGQVYVMDFGLAKVLAARPGGVDLPPPSDPAEPRREHVVGTPGFMAPEMASGRFDRVDERADIFGLGAVLHQIVTGRPPSTGSPDGAATRTSDVEVVTLDERDDELVPKKLARIVRKAMALDPDDRHASVAELAGEVREFLHRGNHLPRETFEPGQAIVREGEIGDRAYIVTRGRCQVHRTVAGERQLLRTLGPGSLFGESAILASAPRIATVEAETAVTVLVLSRSVLEDSFSPDTWEGLLAKTLVERFRELDARPGESGRPPPK